MGFGLKSGQKKKKNAVITGNIFTAQKINRSGEEFKSPSFLNSNLIANNPAPECKENILPWRIVLKFKGGQTTKRSKMAQMAFRDGVQKIKRDLLSFHPALLPYHHTDTPPCLCCGYNRSLELLTFPALRVQECAPFLMCLEGGIY